MVEFAGHRDPQQNNGVLHRDLMSPQGGLQTKQQPWFSSEVGSVYCFHAQVGDMVLVIWGCFLPLF